MVVRFKLFRKKFPLYRLGFFQFMVRGPPVVFEICLYGPSRNTEENSKFKWIAYHTITENPRVMEMAHANYYLSLFLQVGYWHFIKCIRPTLPINKLPTLLSATKEGFKALWTCIFSPSFPCTSDAAPVTQPGTTRIHNRGPEDQSTETFNVYMTFLIVLRKPSNSACIDTILNQNFP